MYFDKTTKKWQGIGDPFETTRILNLLKKNLNQFKIATDGLNIIDWLKPSEVEYPIGAFLQYLKAEGAVRSINIDDISHILRKSGKWELEFQFRDITQTNRISI